MGLVFEEHLEAGYLAFLRYILVYIILLCMVSYVILQYKSLMMNVCARVDQILRPKGLAERP